MSLLKATSRELINQISSELACRTPRKPHIMKAKGNNNNSLINCLHTNTKKLLEIKKNNYPIETKREYVKAQYPILKAINKPQQLKLSYLFSGMQFETIGTAPRKPKQSQQTQDKDKCDFSFDNNDLLPNATSSNKLQKESLQLDKLTIEHCQSPENEKTISDQSPIKNYSPSDIINSLTQTPERKIIFFN